MAAKKQAVGRSVTNLDSVRVPEIKFTINGNAYSVREPGVLAYFDILDKQSDLADLKPKTDADGNIDPASLKGLQSKIMKFQLEMIDLMVTPELSNEDKQSMTPSQMRTIMNFIGEIQSAMNSRESDDEEGTEKNVENPTD